MFAGVEVLHDIRPGSPMLKHRAAGLISATATGNGESATVADAFLRPGPKTAPAFTREDPRGAGGRAGR